LDLTHVVFEKLETGRKEKEIVFRNPETRIVDSRGIDRNRRTWKAVDLDLRQQGFERSDLRRKEES
jgi:hypothetical protein